MFKFAIRATVLFTIGVFFAIILNLVQAQRQVVIFDPEWTVWFSSKWWIPPTCGTAAALIGLLYPFFDKQLGEKHTYRREWSSVMRCIAVFVGINQACTKIQFATNTQFSVTLAAMSIGLWWLFDRSRSGFGLACCIAVIATFVTQLLVYNGIYRYTEPDFLYVRSWLPCIFFSGGITMGNIGRQLAVVSPIATFGAGVHYALNLRSTDGRTITLNDPTAINHADESQFPEVTVDAVCASCSLDILTTVSGQ